VPARSIDRRAPWTLAALFAASTLPLLWIRAYPLNDDWAYGWAVEHWARTGVLRLSQWGAPTLLFQLIWGRLFCLPFGYSFDALRVSTCVLAFAGLLAFFRSLRSFGASSAASLAGSFLLLFNPLFFSLSQSFMTDVPALSLMLLSGWAFVEGARRDRDEWYLAGGCFCALAALVRQTGAGMAFAFAIWLLAHKRIPWRRFARVVLPPAAAALAFAVWTSASGSTFATRSYLIQGTVRHLSDPGTFLLHAVSRLGGASLYLGLFLFPATLSSRYTRAGRWGAVAALATLWLAMFAFKVSPQTGNTIGRFGLGTCTLGADCAFKASGVFGRSWFWLSLTVLAPFSAAALLYKLERPTGASLAYAGGLALAFVASLLGRDYFDRYYLPLFPVFIALLAPKFEMPWRWFAPAVAGLAAWSVFGAWDALAWNQARWEAGHRLLQAGYDPRRVEAGVDWDATYNYEDRIRELTRSGDLRGLDWDSWFKDLPFDAFVTFSPNPRAPGWKPLGDRSYWSPLSLKTERVYLWGLDRR